MAKVDAPSMIWLLQPLRSRTSLLLYTMTPAAPALAALRILSAT